MDSFQPPNTLEQYMGRQLSYQTDVLRAITAMLQATFRDQTYYGLPLENFDETVAWIHRSDQSVSLIAPRRRAGFPSWSWTSNQGPIKHQYVQGGLALWAIPEHPVTVVFTIGKPVTKDTWRHCIYDRKKKIIHVLSLIWLNGSVQNPYMLRNGVTLLEILL